MSIRLIVIVKLQRTPKSSFIDIGLCLGQQLTKNKQYYLKYCDLFPLKIFINFLLVLMNTHRKLSVKVLLQDWWDITEYSEAFQPFHWLYTLILVGISAHSLVCHISLSLWWLCDCGHSQGTGVYHSGWCGHHYCRWQNGFLLVINIHIRCDGLENNTNAHKNHKCYFLGFLKWENIAHEMCRLLPVSLTNSRRAP